ncbi:MAG: cation:proton antiporter [Candidatus Aenigmarchaeota archaeon]|nr:cation:proton antiporter [Candidatus Aenigmarchaeota archaeon]
MDMFTELSIILFLTVLISAVMHFLKQPLIIGYILAGIIAGPVVFNLVQSADTFSTFAQMGITFLLFMVGLNLNFRVIGDVGKTSLLTGIGQVIFTSLIGYSIIRFLLGFSNIISIYLAIAISFSSTIIIMKLLSDKKDLEALYGRISIGFLIVQDLIAIFVLTLISSIQRGNSVTGFAFESVIKGVGSIIVLVLISLYIFPYVTKLIAKSQEFLMLFAISWCFAVASVFNYLNLSIEAGALLAGISLSMTPNHYEISYKMRPLRDFFIILFFVLLGSQMVFASISQYIVPAILLSAFILIGNPLIVMTLMGLLGYTKRNSFLAGLTVAQISEFSLILIALGVKMGHLTGEIISLITLIALITIAGSTYMIIYSNQLYRFLSRYLVLFERPGKKIDEHKYHKNENYDIILFGHDDIGYDITTSLKKIKKKFLIIDYDPKVIINLSKDGYDCKYGDVNDTELLDELNFSKSKMIISTIPAIDTNLLLIRKVKDVNKDAIISVVAQQIDDALKLYDAGATYVIMPHFLGGRQASTLIENNQLSLSGFLNEKVAHIENLKLRKGMGHEHPKYIHH